jgi:hypothetical protein
MAKRSTTPRPRSRAARNNSSDETIAARAPESAPTTMTELPDIPEPGDAADQAQRTESIVTEPSEEEIRLRAYQRFLERGGKHGSHFDDWLAAERDLKSRKR